MQKTVYNIYIYIYIYSMITYKIICLNLFQITSNKHAMIPTSITTYIYSIYSEIVIQHSEN